MAQSSHNIFTQLTPARILNPNVEILHSAKCTPEMKHLPSYLLYCVGRREGSSACAIEIYRVLAVNDTLLGTRYLIEWFYAPERYTLFWVGSSNVLLQKVFCFTGSTPLKRRTFLEHPLVGLVRWSMLPEYVLPSLPDFGDIPVVLPPYSSVPSTRPTRENHFKHQAIKRTIRELRFQISLCPDYAETLEGAVNLLVSDSPIDAPTLTKSYHSSFHDGATTTTSNDEYSGTSTEHWTGPDDTRLRESECGGYPQCN